MSTQHSHSTAFVRQDLKIVIAGAFAAGKTEFISTATELNSVNTESHVSDETTFEKANTTVAMDFGCVNLPSIHRKLFLFGTPGQKRFEFMWEILTAGMHALLLLIDAADLGSARDAREKSQYYYDRFNIPVIIGANKQDLMHAHSIDEIYHELELPTTIPMLPVCACEQQSVLAMLEFIVNETDNWLY